MENKNKKILTLMIVLTALLIGIGGVFAYKVFSDKVVSDTSPHGETSGKWRYTYSFHCTSDTGSNNKEIGTAVNSNYQYDKEEDALSACRSAANTVQNSQASNYGPLCNNYDQTFVASNAYTCSATQDPNADINCDPGEYKANGKCAKCEEQYYCDGINKNKCPATYPHSAVESKTSSDCYMVPDKGYAYYPTSGGAKHEKSEKPCASGGAKGNEQIRYGSSTSITCDGVTLKKLTVKLDGDKCTKDYDGNDFFTPNISGCKLNAYDGDDLVDDVLTQKYCHFADEKIGEGKILTCTFTLTTDAAKTYTLDNTSVTGTGSIVKAGIEFLMSGVTVAKGATLSGNDMNVYIGSGYRSMEEENCKIVGCYSWNITDTNISGSGKNGVPYSTKIDLEPGKYTINCTESLWNEWSRCKSLFQTKYPNDTPDHISNSLTVLEGNLLESNVFPNEKWCNDLSYTGEQLEPLASVPNDINDSSDKIEFSNNKATSAGNHVVTVTPKSGYFWSNGTNNPVEITCEIKDAFVEKEFKLELSGLNCSDNECITGSTVTVAAKYGDSYVTPGTWTSANLNRVFTGPSYINVTSDTSGTYTVTAKYSPDGTHNFTASQTIKFKDEGTKIVSVDIAGNYVLNVGETSGLSGVVYPKTAKISDYNFKWCLGGNNSTASGSVCAKSSSDKIDLSGSGLSASVKGKARGSEFVSFCAIKKDGTTAACKTVSINVKLKECLDTNGTSTLTYNVVPGQKVNLKSGFTESKVEWTILNGGVYVSKENGTVISGKDISLTAVAENDRAYSTSEDKNSFVVYLIATDTVNDCTKNITLRITPKLCANSSSIVKGVTVGKSVTITRNELGINGDISSISYQDSLDRTYIELNNTNINSKEWTIKGLKYGNGRIIVRYSVDAVDCVKEIIVNVRSTCENAYGSINLKPNYTYDLTKVSGVKSLIEKCTSNDKCTLKWTAVNNNSNEYGTLSSNVFTAKKVGVGIRYVASFEGLSDLTGCTATVLVNITKTSSDGPGVDDTCYNPTGVTVTTLGIQPEEPTREYKTKFKVNEYTVLKANVTGKSPLCGTDVTWQSLDESIAVVSDDDTNDIHKLQSGEIKVIGKKAGRVKIRATSVNGGGYAEIEVEVVKQDEDITCVSPTGITVTANPTNIKIGERTIATAKLTGDGTYCDNKVVWESSDTSVATVDQNGNVTGVGEGAVAIIARAVSGGKSDSVIIYVGSTLPDVPQTSLGISTIVLIASVLIGAFGLYLFYYLKKKQVNN